MNKLTAEDVLAIADSHRFPTDADLYYPFLTELALALEPEVSVELGTALGKGAYSIAQGLTNGKVYTIDNNPSIFLEEFYHSKMFRITGDTRTCELISKIDLLFIDGHHDFETVSTDYKRWLPQVNEGGIILFDDANHWGPGELLSSVPHHNIGWLHSYKETGFAFLIKDA